MTDTVWVKQIDRGALGPAKGLQGRWGRWVNPSQENRGLIFGMGELQPGEVAGWHEHPEPELFFVLEGQGQGRWQVDGQEHTADLLPGTAFYKIGGIPHQMINTGDQPFVGVFVKLGAV